jgi:hypothetical protein
MGMHMAKAKKLRQPVVLQVELTAYGWTLKEHGKSHGLFVSKDKAVSQCPSTGGLRQYDAFVRGGSGSVAV